MITIMRHIRIFFLSLQSSDLVSISTKQEKDSQVRFNSTCIFLKSEAASFCSLKISVPVRSTSYCMCLCVCLCFRAAQMSRQDLSAFLRQCGKQRHPEPQMKNADGSWRNFNVAFFITYFSFAYVKIT